MTLVVILTVRRRALDSFRAFERRAATVMARYGGRIERTVVVDPDPSTELLKEVHVVTFPDDDALERYRNDAELAAALPLREASVAATELLVGEDGPEYGG
jgi:uncharacterized protein (DUF1330 family)